MINGNSRKKLLSIALLQIIILEALLTAVFVNKALALRGTDVPQVNKTNNPPQVIQVVNVFKTPHFKPFPEDTPVSKTKKVIVEPAVFDYKALQDEAYMEKFAIRRLNADFMSFTATAYDLSFRCCGKLESDPEYGITFSGTKPARGRTIAVDPDVIPIGSKVYIKFPGTYSKMDGWYLAEDTGSKVKGEIVDVFFGKSALDEMLEFGRRTVKIRIIRPG